MKFASTVLMLICSNAFMTFAWYGHLSTMKSKCWFVAALVSWGIAFFEYMIQVPANRIGSEVMSLSQLKILQEAISLSVFVPFAIFFSKQRVGWNYLLAALCVAAAVFFVFMDRSQNSEKNSDSEPASVADASLAPPRPTDELPRTPPRS
ncbi:MAG: DMT family protein [Thermoguttaceae bacterium]|nr:DMT family protein [Thermoguttaceae bacterium]